MDKRYWLMLAVYNSHDMTLSSPELLGPFATELDRSTTLAGYMDEENLVSHLQFSLPAGVSPGDCVADMNFEPEDEPDQDEDLDDEGDA